MTRIRIHKQKRSRKTARCQTPLEDIGTAGGGSSRLLDTVEELLEDIDQVLYESRQT